VAACAGMGVRGLCVMAPSELAPGPIHGIVSFGGRGVIAGAFIGAVSTQYTVMSATQARAAVLGHSALCGATFAMYGATEGFLDYAFGPAWHNQVMAGAASGSMLGFKTKTFGGAFRGACLFSLVTFTWTFGKEYVRD